jgi:hypothetical protein
MYRNGFNGGFEPQPPLLTEALEVNIIDYFCSNFL